jgi:hypothetical protein
LRLSTNRKEVEKLFNASGLTRIAAIILFGALLPATAGCGDGRPETFKVTGTVIYQGKPLEGASVMFIPKKTRPSSGTTDAQGRFTLLSFSPDDGAVAGEHTVCVSKVLHDSKEPAHSMRNTNVRFVVPQKYSSQLTSPLRAMVTKEGPNDFRFELKD